jgi:hypothetical protein
MKCPLIGRYQASFRLLANTICIGTPIWFFPLANYMTAFSVIYKTRHLKYDTNYKQYENRSYILSEFLDQTWSFIRQGRPVFILYVQSYISFNTGPIDLKSIAFERELNYAQIFCGPIFWGGGRLGCGMEMSGMGFGCGMQALPPAPCSYSHVLELEMLPNPLKLYHWRLSPKGLAFSSSCLLLILYIWRLFKTKWPSSAQVFSWSCHPAKIGMHKTNANGLLPHIFIAYGPSKQNNNSRVDYNGCHFINSRLWLRTRISARWWFIALGCAKIPKLNCAYATGTRIMGSFFIFLGLPGRI